MKLIVFKYYILYLEIDLKNASGNFIIHVNCRIIIFLLFTLGTCLLYCVNGLVNSLVIMGVFDLSLIQFLLISFSTWINTCVTSSFLSNNTHVLFWCSFRIVVIFSIVRMSLFMSFQTACEYCQYIFNSLYLKSDNYIKYFKPFCHLVCVG